MLYLLKINYNAVNSHGRKYSLVASPWAVGSNTDGCYARMI